MKKLATLGVATSIFLSACGPSPTALKAPGASAASAAATAEHVHRDASLGFSLAVPPDMQLRSDSRRSYLDAATWKAYAKSDSQGIAAAALVLDGSNKITAAELRVGVSTDPKSVARCTDVPATAIAAESDTVSLDDTEFVHFHASDAAMSHYLQVESYRAVHDGRCYAIDLWISGTQPQVYDPPATVPFSRENAMHRLHDALAGFQFLD